jgi:hypothetical protein
MKNTFRYTASFNIFYFYRFIPAKINEVKLLGVHLDMSNALNDKDRVEEKLILAARQLAKQNNEKQSDDVLNISGELLNDMVIRVVKFPIQVLAKN